MMMSCRAASRLLSEQQERPLRLGEQLALRLHLSLCGNCRQFARQLTGLQLSLRQLSQQQLDDAGPELSGDARARIAQALQQYKRR